MHLTEGDFDECRVSEDARICVIDAIARFRDIDGQQASECWREIRKRFEQFSMTSKVQFPGTGQRPVDVAAFSMILEILCRLPGKRAASLRAQQATLYSRSLTGDRTICCTVLDRADLLQGTVTITTSTVLPSAIGNADAEQIHATLAQQHIQDRKRARDEGRDEMEIRMLLSKVARTNEGLRTSSTWLQSTIELDIAWAAGVDDANDPTAKRSIYFIRLGETNFVKVGFSRDVVHRMNKLQVACPFAFHQEFAIQTANFREWEAKIHRLLKARDVHVRGEWFDLPEPLDCLQLLRDVGLV